MGNGALEQRRNEVKELEKGMKFGGFIRDKTEEVICSHYSEDIISITEEYCPIGPGFADVAYSVEQMMSNIENGRYKITPSNNKVFKDWLLHQAARCEAEDVTKGERESYWQLKSLSREIRAVVNNLNAFEKRLLWLETSDKENSREMKSAEIAKLPEFNCEAEFITSVLESQYSRLPENARDELLHTNEEDEMVIKEGRA